MLSIFTDLLHRFTLFSKAGNGWKMNQGDLSSAWRMDMKANQWTVPGLLS